MKRTIVAFWIIGAILLIGTTAFTADGNPQSGLPFPDPSLIGRPVIPSPYINRPVIQPYIGGQGNPPYVGRPIIQPPVPVIANVKYVEPEYVSFIKKLEVLPENKIDIGNVALALAKDIHPNLDKKAYSAKIDKLAERVKVLSKGSKDPDARIRSINAVLFWQDGITYDFSDPAGEKVDTWLISGIIDKKKGICYTLPLLYLAVGQRLDYPIYPVTAPDHVFLRYVDPNYTQQNIETTGKGCYGPDENYIEWLKVTPKQIKKGSYLRTLTYKEYLGDLICHNGIHWAATDLDRALYYVAAARRLFPKSPDICRVFGLLLVQQSKYLKPQYATDAKKTGEWCLKTAEDMGVQHLSREDYLKGIQQYIKGQNLKGELK